MEYRLYNGKYTRWNDDKEDWEQLYIIEEKQNTMKYSELTGITFFGGIISFALFVGLESTTWGIVSLLVMILCICLFIWSFTKFKDVWVVNLNIVFKTKKGALRYIEGM